MSTTNHWLDCDLMSAPRVALVQSQEEFDDVLRSAGSAHRALWISSPQANATTTWTEHSDGAPIYIVSLAVKPGIIGIQIAAILVHEAVHVFQYHCEYLGETAPSKEFEAYSIQHISQALMQKYADQL